MAALLWLVAVVLVIVGIVQLIQGQILLGLILIVVAAAFSATIPNFLQIGIFLNILEQSTAASGRTTRDLPRSARELLRR